MLRLFWLIISIMPEKQFFEYNILNAQQKKNLKVSPRHSDLLITCMILYQ